jgi:hypothetical protein
MNKIDELKARNLSEGGKFRLDEVPLRKFYDQAQYIEKTLLPAIEKKSGKDSADYTFFKEIYKSILYAALVVDRENRFLLKMQHVNQMNALLQGRADIAERELLKYTTMEDLLMSDGLDRIAQDVRLRIENLLTNK